MSSKPVDAAAPITPDRIPEFFEAPHIQQCKQQMCEIGSRMWQRGFVDGNGGNLAIRVAPELVLCTPTLVSKGFMKPADLCLVDLKGNQLAGSIPRTSEILMHLQIFEAQPLAIATVHGHPPYGTGLGLAGVAPPGGLLSEFELFVSAAIAPYRTPGTPELGRQVALLVESYNTILMSNHGVVAWSNRNLEDAYFKLEILEAYCKTLSIANQFGKPLNRMSPEQVRDLLRIKEQLGIVDPRLGRGRRI